MKLIIHALCLSCLLVAVPLFFSSCGDQQQGAVKRLHGKDLKFTVKDFHASAGQGDLEGVKDFVEAGMDVDVPDESGSTALIRAAENNRPMVVAFLLEKGANPGIIGPNRRTALIGASQTGADEVVRRLLKAGADPYQQDVDDWSALTLGAYKGHVEAVKVLAPKSNDLLDDALLVSAFEGSPEVMDVLLNHGAYVNARSPNNQTALMIAAMNGHEDGVRLLLHNGANRYALDSEEQTAANVAERNGHYAIAELLNLPPSMQDEMFLPRGDDLGGVEQGLMELASEELTASEGLGDDSEQDRVISARTGIGPIVVPEVLSEGAVAGADGPPSAAVEQASPGGMHAKATLERALVALEGEHEKEGMVADAVLPGSSNVRAVAEHAAGPVRGRSVVAKAGVESTRVSSGLASEVPRSGSRSTGISTRQPERVDGLKLVSVPASPISATSVGGSPAIEGALVGAADESSDRPTEKPFRMTDYREQHLPVMLKSVEGERAEVRVLYRQETPVAVRAGEMIADTGLEVLKFEKKFANSKQGAGQLVDVSQMVVIDHDSGEKHLLVKDLPAKSSETYAVMSLDGSGQSYDVRIHDEFTTQTSDGEERFRVIDVRPTQVVIQNLSTEELYTIPRAAAAMR
ncbi:MAG: ankyrin repeat domain-containing protein [Verrucomicrobiota bacterium]